MTDRLEISALGAQGDGMARLAEGSVHVPFALPGEVVAAQVSGTRASVLEVVTPSPDRVEPACRHFGECGGCALQHLRHEAYIAWKREKVVHALRARGIGMEVAPALACPPGTRRRAVFSVRKTAAGMVLGFNRHMTAQIVPVEECPIAVPEIVASLPTLRELSALLCASSDPFRLTVTATASGLDVAVEGAGRCGERNRQEAIALTIRSGLARLSLGGEILVEPRKPVVMAGSVAIELPPGAFLQATAEAEDAMASLVSAHLAGAGRIADLFSGCGAFALRLAGRSEVHAVESDGAALAALDRAARSTAGLRRVTTERRDLFRRPLTARELDAIEGAVFDPPRAGAQSQAGQIARSQVPLVAAVSCNPVTLARDVAILLEGGYELESVTPIDQFLWSPHVEAVALLSRPRRRRGRAANA